MAAKTKPRIVHTQAEIAVHFGVSIKTVQEWLGKGCPYVPRKTGKPGQYDITKIDEWRREQKGLSDADPLLNGPDSPALEEYRKWKAKREKFSYHKDRKKFLPLDSVVQGLAIFSSTMRQAFDALQRQFGHEALAIVSKALDDSERIFLLGIGTDDVDVDIDDSSSDRSDIADLPTDLTAQGDSAPLDQSVSDDAPAKRADPP
jgi:phage terminase Nu1 subunit (DNA packaging protein)